VYCPRADPARADRVQFKLAFYRALRLRAALLAQAGARVLIVGDLNTSHTVLDHCDPDEVRSSELKADSLGNRDSAVEGVQFSSVL
jgi:exonuclease III